VGFLEKVLLHIATSIGDQCEYLFCSFVSKPHFEPGSKDPIIPRSSALNYVIDKKTGKILFKQRYGSAKN